MSNIRQVGPEVFIVTIPLDKKPDITVINSKDIKKVFLDDVTIPVRRKGEKVSVEPATITVPKKDSTS